MQDNSGDSSTCVGMPRPKAGYCVAEEHEKAVNLDGKLSNGTSYSTGHHHKLEYVAAEATNPANYFYISRSG
jgi:hypothetical protein